MLQKIVKKVGPEVHIIANSLMLLIAVFLLIVVGIVAWRHLKLKLNTYMYVYSAQVAEKQRLLGADSVEDADMLATTLMYPQTASLLSQKAELQNLVSTLSKQTKRDIVVMDMHKVILADSVSSSAGKIYSFDPNKEVEKTLTDGNPRSFVEKSSDYPSGVNETVVALKDTKGSVVGALILSYSTLLQ